jgi:A/G-specific adenine glycosylase
MRGDFPSFRKKLLDWYAAHRRPLPWRTDSSLYRTVVSEFMLQQTQVDTVLPYFERWMRALPDFAALAAAPEERILKLWEGLGYYSRARNLQRLAQSITAGGIPATVAGWRARPGIGPYTAAAIGSIAQGLPEPVIDGNVIRVLTRLDNDATPIPSAAAAHKRFRPLAAALLDPDRPGDFNEAMMELGATVCRKAAPDCPGCPVAGHCAALAAGTAARLPVIPRQRMRSRIVHRLWRLEKGRLLLQFHSPDARRLANLAELPLLPEDPVTVPTATRVRTIGNERVTEHIHALPASHPALRPCRALPDQRWIPIGELDAVTLSAPHRKWIRQLLEG